MVGIGLAQGIRRTRRHADGTGDLHYRSDRGQVADGQWTRSVCNWSAPRLIEIGTPEQKERFLGRILRGEMLWCQGFSEPNAGSDLASVQTKAVLEGDEWVINGQKIWSSDAP